MVFKESTFRFRELLCDCYSDLILLTPLAGGTKLSDDGANPVHSARNPNITSSNLRYAYDSI